MALKRYRKSLKKNGLKITPKREGIIGFFLKKGYYATPEEVWKNLKTSFKKIGLPTVYRNLKQLSKIGILTRLEGKEDRFYYGLCQAEKSEEHHHHIVCLKCQKVSEVEDCRFEDSLEKIEVKTGFKVVNHSLQLQGLCQQCQK